MAVKTLADTALVLVVTAVAVAMRWYGVESWTPAITSTSGPPNPSPATPPKTIALVELLGWIVARPTMPAVNSRNPTNIGDRIDLNFVLAKP